MEKMSFMTIAKHKIANGAVCEVCGTGNRLEAHHRIPRVLLPKAIADSEINMVILCENCHSIAHKAGPDRKLLTRIGINRNKIECQTISRIKLLKKIDDKELIYGDEMLQAIFDAPTEGYYYPTDDESEYVQSVYDVMRSK